MRISVTGTEEEIKQYIEGCSGCIVNASFGVIKCSHSNNLKNQCDKCNITTEILFIEEAKS